jgi:ATP-dependent DNA helicase RecQ
LSQPSLTFTSKRSPMSTPVDELEAWLRARFKLGTLRTGQLDVVRALFRGQRVLFVAPTGHGKSLTYQALAANGQRGVVVVFQPLKALMAEQVQRARAQGLTAAEISSDLNVHDQRRVLNEAVRGDINLLFVAPERLDNALWQELAPQLAIKGVVIDEAHCISIWGHDFRPAYRQLVRITSGMGLRTPVLAVTATAPHQVVQDVQEQIAASGTPPLTIRLPSARQNLRYSALEVDGLVGRLAMLARIANHINGPGIAYVLTTTEARIAAAFLNHVGISAVAYYGGLEATVRHTRLQGWTRNEVRVVCATSALGMGMDRQDIRWIVHLGVPDSLVRYVQEVGRAGRDGREAWGVVLHDPELADVYHWLAHGGHPSRADYAAVAKAIRSGSRKRTDIVVATDVPETATQHILNEFLLRQLVRRSTGQPYEYVWVDDRRDGTPEHGESIELRQKRIDEALTYAASTECRAVHLARAMGDDPLPGPCGICDRCANWTWREDPALLTAADQFVAAWQPDLDCRVKEGGTRLLQRGKALSLYKLGPVGRAVADAKAGGRTAPAEAVAAAVQVVRDPSGPYSGVSFSAVVSIPSTRSGGFVSGFAAQVAGRLGVPHIELTKTRTTGHQKGFRARPNQRRNVAGAFAIPPGVVVSGAVLLVDDLWDSGETLKEAARILRPTTIYPLVMARTRDSDDG